ncbi:MAG: CvpA family protein [Tissierellia bacterium]|nr:CvpA family protein [Tissierellia bacterium]MDD3225928.1 CvpA family protein [Tissierellia bacterium]MDD3750874.1 CvpA family protein [Tissierellia bacterium]MDD4045855.1 CvpA family protein [Tissierellia bacterium]MDD4678027.1 CvpA family protein [Tissierellia bacterium]
MVIDVIIVIFVGYLFFQGYRKGFILTVFDTLGIIISFFLSREMYHFAENFLLNNTKLFVKLHDYFEAKLSVSTVNNISKIPVELQKFVNNIMASEASDTFAIFVDNMSLLVIRSISFVVTFLAIYAILLILTTIINTVMKLPLLNLTNRLLGAFMGIVKSVILLYLIFALATPLISFMYDKPLAQSVLDSESSKIFYDNNIILNYLSYKGFYEN